LIDPATRKSTLQDPRWQTIIQDEFLQFAKDPHYQQVSQKYRNGGIPNLNQFMKDRVLAMYPNGPLLPTVYPNEMSEFDWDIIAAPTHSANKGTGFSSYPDYMSVTASSQEKDMAMEVIKFITSAEFQ